MEWTGERWVPGKSPQSVERQHLARYHWAKKFCRGKRVLDFGCGCGAGAEIMGEPALVAEGWDIDSEAVKYAWNNHKRENVVFATDEGDAWKPHFDLAVCFEVIEHVDDTGAHNIMERLQDSLVDGGLLLLSTPNRARGNRPQIPIADPWHMREYNEQELRELVTPWFCPIAYLGQVDVRNYVGPECTGTHSLIGVEHLDVAEFLVYVGRKY